MDTLQNSIARYIPDIGGQSGKSGTFTNFVTLCLE